jgi:SAM-dependent methyltransferase
MREQRYSGHCAVCGEWTEFVDMSPSIRETYQCQICRASMRERVMAQAIVTMHGGLRVDSLKALAAVPEFARLKIYEPGVSGAFRPYLRGLAGYENSFFWDGGRPGEVINGVPHQDLEQLSFADQSFDLVLSSDIFEHVRKPWDGFSEVHRILKPGGLHIFSIPLFHVADPHTVSRIDTSGPTDVDILERRYHGDGRGGKSVVYTDFGSDILRKLGDIGFKSFPISADHVDRERRRVIALVSLRM